MTIVCYTSTKETLLLRYTEQFFLIEFCYIFTFRYILIFIKNVGFIWLFRSSCVLLPCVCLLLILQWLSNCLLNWGNNSQKWEKWTCKFKVRYLLLYSWEFLLYIIEVHYTFHVCNVDKGLLSKKQTGILHLIRQNISQIKDLEIFPTLKNNNKLK